MASYLNSKVEKFNKDKGMENPVLTLFIPLIFLKSYKS